MAELDLNGIGGMMNHHSKKKQDVSKKKTTAWGTKNIQNKASSKNSKGRQDSSPIKERSKGNSNRSKYEPQDKGKQKHKTDKKDERYVGAPYNFVPIREETYEYSKEKYPMHNVISSELLSGCIEYKVKALTKILVDGGEKEGEERQIGKFYVDAYGRYAIPGSTMRGLVRSNAQILSFSDFDNDIDDYELMYRNVANGADKKRYKDILGSEIKDGISILKNVRAGYIANEQGEYKIYQTCVDKIEGSLQEERRNYYYKSEEIIKKNYNKYDYLYSEKFEYKMQNGSNAQSEEAYKPYSTPISYKLEGNDDIEGIGESGKFKYEGYLLSSGFMNNKKVIYIIPEIDENKKPILIPTRDIDTYKRDFENKKNQIKEENEAFYSLPKEGEKKPVFFIEQGNRLYFGFTPRLRLAYDNTVKKGFKQRKTEMDYCKAMFGMTTETMSYKSRISFRDAYTESREEEKEDSRILAEPKPTSYLDYIQQNNSNSDKAVTYNNDDFKLRGVKQYWLKEEVIQGEAEKKNEKVKSRIRALKKGTDFSGKVYFKNLREDELGLLLWSLELNEESQQNIGKAKPYGYGRVKIKIKDLEIFSPEKAYNIEQFSLNPYEKRDKEHYIQKFKEEMKQVLKFLELGNSELEEVPNIQEFFWMKDGGKILSKEKTRYMSIDKKEYQSRKSPLKTVKEIMKENSKI